MILTIKTGNTPPLTSSRWIARSRPSKVKTNLAVQLLNLIVKDDFPSPGLGLLRQKSQGSPQVGH
jgi:hypothetical protein